jgi:hypothetical protein
MRAKFAHHPHLALAVFEDHQIFSQDSGAHGGAIALRDFFTQAHRLPVSAHELAHGSVAFDAANQLVLLFCHHGLGLKWRGLNSVKMIRSLSLFYTFDHFDGCKP